ncbi:MAG: SufE family protein [Candidatus Marinimicrobia bacterium]|jgi:sulfur transfer protein SufE|nr:SufE family protein [Candidatus Neomarinimicrobiota bacterium]MBT3495702.1 SufE family protein [Candidatus Neomarinimicrobiota bacterium]MBT3691666.1 SufE family protein [Candidatus Neomarinimicrobiota bacterium]MBT3731605.1 SufE family protein [Candidatus Neomarinimicrobiota bacterium]MBT4144831.1 SufE family protein [Candidatus Neomarinimicrobiota bacterium]
MNTLPIPLLLQDMQDLFNFFDDPKDKYAQLIDFGQKAPGLKKEDFIEENRIYGCSSNAWVKIIKNENRTYAIQTDSDALIVKGLLSLLEKLIAGQDQSAILSIESKTLLEAIGLGGSISGQRSNGFMNAIEKIQSEIQK